jgi:hypothetical protein
MGLGPKELLRTSSVSTRGVEERFIVGHYMQCP